MRLVRKQKLSCVKIATADLLATGWFPSLSISAFHYCKPLSASCLHLRLPQCPVNAAVGDRCPRVLSENGAEISGWAQCAIALDAL